MLQDDMREIFSVMSGYPTTIRLLDPPLHEFLPSEVSDGDTRASRPPLPPGAIELTTPSPYISTHMHTHSPRTSRPWLLASGRTLTR